MTLHNFTNLYAQYPGVIEEMPEYFTSHQFIIELARCNQTGYIEALYAYRHSPHRGAPAPFLHVHRILSQGLHKFPESVVQVRKDAPSKDIFLQGNVCTEWRRIT